MPSLGKTSRSAATWRSNNQCRRRDPRPQEPICWSRRFDERRQQTASSRPKARKLIEREIVDFSWLEARPTAGDGDRTRAGCRARAEETATSSTVGLRLGQNRHLVATRKLLSRLPHARMETNSVSRPCLPNTAEVVFITPYYALPHIVQQGFEASLSV